MKTLHVLAIVCFLTEGLGQSHTDRYQFTVFSTPKSFQEAERYCNSLSSKLPELKTKAIEDAVADAVKNARNDHWIGATDKTNEGVWKWLDGTSVINGNWASTQPDNWLFIEDCASIRPSSYWNDIYCGDALRFICQKSISSRQEISSEGHWYTFYRLDSKRSDFNTAQRKCAKLGARLAEAHYPGTIAAVQTNSYTYFIDSGKQDHYWMGGTYSGESTWRWNSGSPIGDNGWSAKIGLGNCLASSKNGWVQKQCQERLPYICESAPVKKIVLSTQSVEAGKETKSIDCTVDGAPVPNVYWAYGDEIVSSNSGSSVYQTKDIGKATLNFGRSVITDEGEYTCWGVNTVKGDTNWESSALRLIVPSSPVINNVSANACKSSLVISWTPNRRAVGVRHRIQIQGDHVKNEMISTSNVFETFSYLASNLSDSSRYNISITPCAGECNTKYTTTVKDVLTGGRPEKVSKVAVISGTGLTCIINWSAPVVTLKNAIIDHQITILKEMPTSENKLFDPSSKNWTESIDANSTWMFRGKPNRKYRFGIKARTCAGTGPLVSPNELCITEKRAPEFVPQPRAESLIRIDGKVELSVPVPDQTNGLISCLFVIVEMERDNRSFDRNISLDDLKLMQLNDLNSETPTNKYTALAIDVLNSTGKEAVVLLGDGKKTICDVHERPSRRKRRSEAATSDGKIIGRNRKLDPQKIYEIAVISTTPSNGNVFLKTSEILYLNKIEENSSGRIDISPIIGGVVGVLLIVLLAVVIAWRKIRKDLENGKVEEHSRTEITRDTEVIYQNSAVLLDKNKKSDTDIAMADLEEVFRHMKNNDYAPFTKEFQKLIREASIHNGSTEVASKPELKRKNRYKNILPFDDSRVRIENSDSGYINACYIDGYQDKRKFIATQGPLPTSVVDFWLMVIEQNCTIIVMLARCCEAGKKKCEKYWPDLKASQRFGCVTVTSLEEIRFCGFIQRTFRVEANLQDRGTVLTVCQYNFTKWPDHGVPFTTSHLTRMHKEVMKAHTETATNSPIIVHCSAGAGRTGTFIGYDIVLQESKKQRSVDFYRRVLDMRKQRVDMVQNSDQYILVHKLLLEQYLFGETDLAAAEASENFSDIDYRINVAASQFKNLSKVGPLKTLFKNTNERVSPQDRMKITLSQEGSDARESSVEASFVESYDETLKLIVSDGPTDETAESFWNVVLQCNVQVVVTLDAAQGRSKINGRIWPVEVNTFVQCSGMKISLRKVTTTEHFIKRIILVQEHDKNVELTNLLLQDRKENLSKAKQFISAVDEMQRLLREHQQPVTLIHCNDKSGSAGVFCAVVNLIERLKVEHRVDVFRTVKDLRDCKPATVQSLDEYILCHQAVIDYFSSFDVYSNFR